MVDAVGTRATVSIDHPYGGGRAGRQVPVLSALGLVQGAALAVVVGADGSMGWQVARALLVALLSLAAVRALRRTTPKRRALIAVVLGVAGVVVGVGIGALHLTHAVLDVTAVAGLVCLGTGAVLLAAGTVMWTRAAAGWHKLLVVPVALAVLTFVLYPAAAALYATNVPRPMLGSTTPADLDMNYVEAEFLTPDGITLTGWYLPSTTGAAVVLLHGASSTRSSVLDQAAVLARHGYGVLLFDARGHGRSGGTAMDFGWYGDLDIAGAVSYLQTRPDVDPTAIGAVGMSMGGEQVIGAAAADPRIRAVVAEGATGRALADKGWLPNRWNGWIQRGIDAVLYGVSDVLTDAAPPISLRDAVRATAPRPVLLIAGGAVLGHAEEDADRWIQEGSPDNVAVWVVPASGHIGGLRTQPREWESRVTEFLDAALIPAGKS